MRLRAGIPRAAAAGVVPFLVTFAAFTALMASANLPTTLYAVYADEFGFSSLVVTLVFATYAVVLAPSLLTFGQLSDRARLALLRMHVDIGSRHVEVAAHHQRLA